MTMNSSRILVPFRCTWVLTLILLCFLLAIAKTQADYGCSVQNIDLQKCLNQSNDSMYIKDSCCKTLNQIAQAGFNCLCSLIRSSSIVLLTPPLALPFSNCFISAPPLSLCRALDPVPVLLPPDSPKEQTQLSSPPDVVVVSYPPREVQVPPTNLTMDGNSSTVSRQPYVKENDDDDSKHCVSPNGAGNSNTRMCLWQTLLILSFWVFL